MLCRWAPWCSGWFLINLCRALLSWAVHEPCQFVMFLVGMLSIDPLWWSRRTCHHNLTLSLLKKYRQFCVVICFGFFFGFFLPEWWCMITLIDSLWWWFPETYNCSPPPHQLHWWVVVCVFSWPYHEISMQGISYFSSRKLCWLWATASYLWWYATMLRKDCTRQSGTFPSNFWILYNETFTLNNYIYHLFCALRCPSDRQHPKMLHHRCFQRVQLHGEALIVIGRLADHWVIHWESCTHIPHSVSVGDPMNHQHKACWWARLAQQYSWMYQTHPRLRSVSS